MHTWCVCQCGQVHATACGRRLEDNFWESILSLLRVLGLELRLSGLSGKHFYYLLSYLSDPTLARISVHVCGCACACMYVHTCAWTHARLCVFVCVYVYVFMHMWYTGVYSTWCLCVDQKFILSVAVGFLLLQQNTLTKKQLGRKQFIRWELIQRP